ncbi:CBS domain protein [Tenacibaculum adriaticum]|uniref:CBS domain protein n=1 Tax=Tenacibaculum adriaticum TaxID=413713 RepID=A0A5S5DWI2_9FLAO|nr:CBS domain-containing protein [Tenacibaculum adriaticum]TYQ00284.1 CBS domain protein [Tenacibaculum adriaticum]
MNINDYILKEIKALSLHSTVKKAQQMCKNYPISHFPIIEKNKLLGCVAESDIRTIENTDAELKEYTYLFHHFFATENTSLLDLIALFADNDCNLIPVLNQEQFYIGYYDLTDILDLFADSPFMHHDNETLIVSTTKTDFSMSQVSQIVESNNARLLGLYVSHETVDDVQITLKISSEEMNEIIQTFRRYNYHVITQHEDDFYLDQLKDRANYLKKYLGI